MLKLQRVQYSLARVVTYTKRIDHIHHVLHQLHWLPVNYRINYKVATLAYRVYGQQEVKHTYFRQSVTISSNQKSMVILTKYAQRARRQYADS